MGPNKFVKNTTDKGSESDCKSCKVFGSVLMCMPDSIRLQHMYCSSIGTLGPTEQRLAV
jgi:hypothetical protein